MNRGLIAGILLLTVGAANADKAKVTEYPRNEEPYTYFKSWEETYRLSGLFLGEVIASNYNPSAGRFQSRSSYNTFCFPRAVVNFDSIVNEWFTAHIGMNFRTTCCYGAKNDEWAFRKFNNIDSVYVDYKNYQYHPYKVRLGIQYLNYGFYERNKIPATFVQMLSQTHVNGAQISTSWRELDGAFFIFSGKKKRGHPNRIKNGGIQLGHTLKHEDTVFRTSIDYMLNIAAAPNFIVSRGDLNTAYRKAVGGLHATFKIENPHYDILLQATQSLTNFNSVDLNYMGHGARPAALLLGAGYHFQLNGTPSRIGFHYQRSFESVNFGGGNGFGLPEQRYQADWNIFPLAETTLGAHLIYDIDYAVANGGTGRSSVTGIMTLKLKFPSKQQ